MKWINRLITTFLFVMLISVALLVVITKISGGEPQVLGYQLKTVLSGSMEPDIKTGSIIAVKLGGDLTRFKENDVITFMEEENHLITHRVIDVVQSGEHTMYYTKGDNNNAPDINPVLSENIVAEYTGFTVPYIGYFINFSQSQNGAFLLLIPGILLLLYSGFTIWKALAEIDVSNKRAKTDLKEEGNRLSS